MILVHGTSVEIGGRAVLIRGPSGSGKSDLALRLIDQGAVLVADDQTELVARDGRVEASCPATIAGLMEVRGLGILRLPHLDHVPLALVVDLVPADQVERQPDPQWEDILAIPIRRVALAAFEGAATAKVRLAMASTSRDIMHS